MANANILNYIDPFDSIAISYDGKNFSNNINKKSFIGSRVSYNDVILHTFKVPTSTSDDELKINVEIKMYDDAGLDVQKKYKISYSKKELDFEENVLVEAFAIEVDTVTKSLESVLSRTKHIDFLALPFLSFSTLYKNKIIEAKNDIFVYIDENEAFLSIYKDGKYLSSKSLINLEEMVKKLETDGVDITINQLKEHLIKKGLDASIYERGETTLFNGIEAIFAAMLNKINDIVIYNRSVFGFEKVDRIFLSMHNGRIKGIRKFIVDFGFSDVEVRDFNMFRNKEDGNFFEKIIASYINDKLESKDFSHNLTVFTKEPPFYKKESGAILLIVSSIILLSLLYIGFIEYENIELEKQKNMLQERYDIVKKNQKRYKQQINAVNKELKNTETKKESMDLKVQNIEKNIMRLKDIRDSKIVYSEFVFDVNNLLKKYNLSTTKIEITGKNSMNIEIVAQYKKRDSITMFMEDLIDGGFIGIKTDEIKLDKDIYMSKIEIKR